METNREQKPERTRGVVADCATQEALRACVNRHGWQRSYELLGVGQHPIARILSGQYVLRSTLVMVRLALSKELRP